MKPTQERTRGGESVTCRRCSECVGAEHHWIENDEVQDENSPEYACKHCDATAFMCVDCEEPVAAADTRCLSCAASAADTTPDAGVVADLGHPPDDVLAAWDAACKCCRDCELAPCGAVQQGGVCEAACRCDERQSAREDDYDPLACPGCGGSCQTACR